MIEEILDDEIPGGSAELPKTGELPPMLYYGTGTALVAIGAYFRRKLKKKI
ncbi:MAG: LPXTG cell wall anchor domain-containing protein [Clostridiales bacterium]|nr:LPXTG cell wall anchor domain-containing protein [Clostridiales bacterium]